MKLPSLVSQCQWSSTSACTTGMLMNLLRRHSFALHYTHVATAICIATHRVLRMHYAIAVSIAANCLIRMCQLLHRHTLCFAAPPPLAHVVMSPPLQVPPDGAADVTYVNLPTVCPVPMSRGNSAPLHTVIVPFCNISAQSFNPHAPGYPALCAYKTSPIRRLWTSECSTLLPPRCAGLLRFQTTSGSPTLQLTEWMLQPRL